MISKPLTTLIALFTLSSSTLAMSIDEGTTDRRVFLNSQAIIGNDVAPVTQRTIGHEVIGIELLIPGRRDGSSELERLIIEATRLIAKANLHIIDDDEAQAIEVLRLIGESLRANGYQTHSETYPKELTTVLTSSTSVFDCDTGGLIYLSVGEHLRLPLSMVEIEIPGDSPDGHDDHNIVRWQLSDDQYIDWEVTENRRYEGTKEDSNYGYPWTRDQLLGHFHYLRGNAWDSLNRYFNMISDYDAAIRLFPESHKPRNSIAWILSTVDEVQSMGRQEEALQRAQEAVSMYPSRDNRDTLACAYAINGQFDEAIKIQAAIVEAGAPEGYAGRLEKMKNGKNCLGE